MHTPILDALAEQAAKFTDFYAGSAVCSPSRASMLTGRFALRTGVYSWIHPTQKMYLRTEEATYAKMLKQAGYRDPQTGKPVWSAPLNGIDIRQRLLEEAWDGTWKGPTGVVWPISTRKPGRSRVA